VDEARKVIASSALRRVLRIGLPATFGTMFAWGLAQMGAFTLAPYVELEGMWLAASTPKRVPGFFASVLALIKACVLSFLLLANCSLRHGLRGITTTNQINGVWHGRFAAP
jgi:hypothetical protein